MTDQAKPISRHWRRFTRFSVRGMIVVLLLVGGWPGWIARGARIQREAVEAIEKAGGTVMYNWEYSNGTMVPAGNPWAPTWLVNLIGVDCFGHVTSVSLSQTGSGTTYAQVERLTRLERLNLLTSSLDYSGLERPKGLTNLAVLSLIGTKVTDADLVNLKGLTKLTVLDLGSTQVTDAGFVHLAGLPHLARLRLSHTRVTDAGLAHLNGRFKLISLDLSGTFFTDSGLWYLYWLPNLSDLNLSNTNVSDAGLVHLKGLTSLSILDLGGNIPVTDAGLAHLKGLAKLSFLDLTKTRVTDAGVKGLQQALPSLKIIR
jgi:Leucine-rich repeat (LRR) protein